MIHVEIKDQRVSKGTLVKLFDEVTLHLNWTDDVVEAIKKSLRLGTWQRVAKLEVRATKVRSKTGWKKV
jgi:hypothetical protein